MTKTLYKTALNCVAALVISMNSYGQNAVTDTTSRQAQIDNIVASYYSTIGEQSRLFNGPEYNFYSKLIKGSPYFTESPEFTIGTVEYDGFVYKNLQMMYDLYKEVVVMQLPSKVASIELLSNRVQSFDIFGHHFLRMDAIGQLPNQNLEEGFYDLMYNGKSQLLIHRQKTVQISNASATFDSYFTDEDKKMWLKINGTYKSFNSQKSLLEILKDKKTDLKRYLKDNHINFKQDKEQAFVKVVAYYDQITN